MTTYISLLRGINVSGHRMIPMDALKACYASLGYSNIDHYIQSGNIIFGSSEKNTEKIAGNITRAIATDFGFEVPVLVKTNIEWKKIIRQNPFLKDNTKEEAFLHACFLANAPDKKSIALLQTGNYAEDRFEVIRDVVYLYCPGGYGKTKLNNGFWESKFKTDATTRNWKTIQQLCNMADQLP